MPLPAITRVSNMEIKSDAKNKENGLRIDAITTTQRDAIPTKTAGLTISNSTTGTLQTYQNGAWSNVSMQGGPNIVKYTATGAADYQVLITDSIIGVTDTAAARNITLPAVANTAGQIFTIKDESDHSNAITIVRNGAKIDGVAANIKIDAATANGGAVSLYSNGTAWFTTVLRIA